MDRTYTIIGCRWRNRERDAAYSVTVSGGMELAFTE